MKELGAAALHGHSAAAGRLRLACGSSSTSFPRALPAGQGARGTFCAPGSESEKARRWLRVSKHPTPRHNFLRLFPLSSLTLLSVLESNPPGPLDRKSFLALLPWRYLSLQEAVSERKTPGPRERLGAPHPHPRHQGPAEPPFIQKDPLFCSQMALFWSLEFLSESSGMDWSHGLPPPANNVRTQYPQPFNNFKGSRDPDI